MITFSKKSLIITGSVLGVLLIGVGILYFVTKKDPAKEASNVELTYWGVYDSPDVIQPIIDAYEKEHANVNITYVQKKFDSYENDLRNAFAEGAAPDIFTLQHMLVSKYEFLIEPLPEEETPLIDEYFDVVEQDVLLSNRIYGLPYSVDSLALFYNKKMLQAAGITNPPRTWDEFNTAVQKLSDLNSEGKFLQSGAALGGSSATINRATDLLALFMLQQGTPIVSRETGSVVWEEESINPIGKIIRDPGLTGLNEYLRYSKPTESVYTWNENQNYSFDLFAEEKLGMVFGYSYALPIIRNNNPKMDLGIIPAPQIKDSTNKISYASYWIETVSAESKDPKTAWDFVKFATNKENVKLYSSATNKPVSRRDLVNEQLNDADLSAFAEQNIYAEAWFQYDGKEVETILDVMLKEILAGTKIREEAFEEATNKIQSMLQEAKSLKDQIKTEEAEKAEKAAKELQRQETEKKK